MNNLTLREVCEVTKVSRRAIQGYEQAGLVTASARNERGYLLYDEKSCKKIQQIRLFQDLGFSVKEITEIIDAPKEELKVALESKISILQEKGDRIEVLISKARKLINQL